MKFHVGSYVLGILTPFVLLGIFVILQEVWKLWTTICLYGGEQERNLTWFGLVAQRTLLWFYHRLPRSKCHEDHEVRSQVRSGHERPGAGTPGDGGRP